jgi:ribosomal protein S18 acetylase RimI-like enzyme
MATTRLRDMTAADATLIAALHAASWRSAYRGILSDAYLAGDIDRERADHWGERLRGLDVAEHFGLVAMHDEAAVGFVFVMRDAAPDWGALIDNLHVSTAMRSAGIGQRLLVAAADGIAARAWGDRMHLWVFDANVRARAFYARLGGTEVERIAKALAGGGTADASRVVWTDLEPLRTAPPPR